MADDLFRFKEEDWRLIEAAIELGDWLIGHGATETQAEAIRLLQDALRRLPEPTRGLHADYGFRVQDRRVREADKHRNLSEPEKIPVPYPDEAIHRSWLVAMYRPPKGNPEGHIWLEIGSTFGDLPRQDVMDEMPHELDYLISTAAAEPWPWTYNYDRWIREVSDPTQYIGEHEYLEISTSMKRPTDDEYHSEWIDVDPAML